MIDKKLVFFYVFLLTKSAFNVTGTDINETMANKKNLSQLVKRQFSKKFLK